MTATRASSRTAPRIPARIAPSVPRGTLFFVHGANETSAGLVRTVARIQDQVTRRGWDVRVVAPEWRRRSNLRLGNWRGAIFRAGRPPAIPLPNLGAGIRKDAVMKMVTSYFEFRREALLEMMGTQLLADVIGYHRHRASIHAALREELELAADEAAAADSGPVLPVALSLGGVALIDLLADWPGAPVEACVTVGSPGATAVYLRCPARAALRRGRPPASPRVMAQHL